MLFNIQISYTLSPMKKETLPVMFMTGLLAIVQYSVHEKPLVILFYFVLLNSVKISSLSLTGFLP